MATTLDPAIEFLRAFGFFDIILPFLLIFTLVFAILEKTRVLGEEDGRSKKNLNAIVAFALGLLVIATSKIVDIFTEALPNVILLLVISIAFLILIGTFWTSGELDFKKEHKGWYAFLVVVFFIAVILIFLQAIKVDGDNSVLEVVINYVVENFGGAVVGGFIILAVIIISIWFVVRSPEKEGEKK